MYVARFYKYELERVHVKQATDFFFDFDSLQIPSDLNCKDVFV